MSFAKRLILLLGISYKKDSEGWFKVGGVRVHPDDNGLLVYPPAILKENQYTFMPDPFQFENGNVIKWGLKDPDVAMETEMMSSRALLSSNLSLESHRSVCQYFGGEKA